jgi:hypothetical protein
MLPKASLSSSFRFCGGSFRFVGELVHPFRLRLGIELHRVVSFAIHGKYRLIRLNPYFFINYLHNIQQIV